jgi:hypothetical protein
MLAAVGWLVQEVWHPLFGGTIEGDSFTCAPCLDAFLRSRSAHLSFRLPSRAPGPALGHFQQVPAPFWQLLTLAIGIAETMRARKGWQEPTPEGWFKLRPDYSPGARRAR